MSSWQFCGGVDFSKPTDEFIVSDELLPLILRPEVRLCENLVWRERVFYLTQCINEMVLESQLPHKILNLLFTISDSQQ